MRVLEVLEVVVLRLRKERTGGLSLSDTLGNTEAIKHP
jgi:hypothetical protein